MKSSSPHASPHPHIWRRVGIIVAIVVGLVILAAWLVLRSGPFQGYVIRTAQQSASEALGQPVHIAGIRLHVHSFSPSVDLYGITIAGRPIPDLPTPQPLLVIPHAHVTVHVTSLLHRKVQIQNVQVDHPVVHIYMDAHGRTNLPAGPAHPQPSPDIFKLGIRHVAIHDASVFSAAKRQTHQSLSADLSGVEFTVAYNQNRQSYDGQLSYSSGIVQVAPLAPLNTTMALVFSASRSGVQVSSLHCTAPGTQLTATANVAGYTPPRLTAHYQLHLDLATLAAAARFPGLPKGTVQLSGTAAYGENGITAAGDFSSSRLVARAAALTAPISNLSGIFQYASDQLTVGNLRARVAGGELAGSLELTDLAAAPALHATLRLRSAHLGQLARVEPHAVATLTALGITGTLNASIVAQGRLDRPRIRANVALAATVAGAPLHANARVSFASGVLGISSASLSTPHARLTASGSLGAHARLQLSASSSNLAALEALSGRIASAFGKPLPPLGLVGRGSLEATVTGSLAAPSITAQLDASPLAVRGTHWTSLRLPFTASPSEVSVHNAVLTAARARIDLDGSLALSHWQPTSSSPLQAALRVSALPLADLAPLLPSRLPVAGTLNAEARATGTLGAPAGKGSLTLTSARLLGKGVHPGLEQVHVDAVAASGAIHAQLTARLAAGDVNATVEFHPSTGAYQATLSAPSLALAKLPPVAAARLGVRGTLALAGSGSGTLRAPALQVDISSPTITLDGQTLHTLKAHLSLQANTLAANLSATALQTPLQAHAELSLAGDMPVTVSLDAPAVPLAPLLAAFPPQQAVTRASESSSAISGETAVHVRLHGPVRHPAQLQASINLPTFALRYGKAVSQAGRVAEPRGAPRQSIELHAAAPLEATLAAGVIHLAPAHLVGTETDLNVEATVPVPALGATAAPMAATVSGTVGLKLAEAFVPGLNASGQVQVHVTAAGTLAHPAVNGVIQIANAAVTNPAWPVAVQNGHGALRLSGDRLDLVGFTASLGGGTLTVGGGMSLAPTTRFNFTVAAQGVHLRYPPGLRETITANVNLTGTPTAGLLSGRVAVDDISTAPGFDFSSLTAQLAQNSVTVATPGGFLNDLRLQVALTTPNQIAIVSRDFSLHANANLTLRGTAQEPVVLGRVDLTSGDLIFRGNRYVIQTGTLDFLNPIRTVPNVNVTADTTIEQYNLHLHFEGPVDNLRASYTSDPSLPPADIINLLAFGQTTEAGAANPLPGNLGAESLVAGAVTGQITDRVEKIAGISHLSVDPVLGGGQQNAGARITLQQRVTANLYVTISTDVTGTQRNVIEVQYKLSPRVSVTGVRKQNGGFGANLQFKKTWH
ncbi:MAG: translocation/assembly module TamB domain-containing protein [Terriglobales bacterium]